MSMLSLNSNVDIHYCLPNRRCLSAFVCKGDRYFLLTWNSAKISYNYLEVSSYLYYCLFASHPVQFLKFIVLCTKRAGIVFAVFTWYDLTWRNRSKLGLDREYHSFSKTVHSGLLQRTGNTDHAWLLKCFASAHILTLNIAEKWKRLSKNCQLK